MVLDGFSDIKQSQHQLRAPHWLPVENDQSWKTFSHCRLSEGTQHMAWRGDQCVISFFCESQDVHFTPQNRT
jgi:phage terminase small subunit